MSRTTQRRRSAFALALALAALAAIGSAGCARSRAIEASHPAERRAVATIAVREASGSLRLPWDVSEPFDQRLAKRLNDRTRRDAPGDLAIVYCVTRFDPGSRAARYWAGIFGAGAARLDADVEFLDAAGQSVGATRIETTLRIGVFGGGLEEVGQATAERIADYVDLYFTDPASAKR